MGSFNATVGPGTVSRRLLDRLLLGRLLHRLPDRSRLLLNRLDGLLRAGRHLGLLVVVVADLLLEQPQRLAEALRGGR